LYFATTNDYGAGSKTRMMIDHNGNVGIGTTSPGQKLDVYASSGSVMRLSVTDGAGSGDFGTDYYIQNTGHQIARISAEYVSSAANGYGSIHFSNRAGGALTKRMTILYDGNVGIGTTNPGAKLHVTGDILLSNTAYFGPGSSIYASRGGSTGNDFEIGQNADSGSVLSLFGAGEVQIHMDSNNNETGQKISFRKNATKNGTEVASINEDGNMTLSGTLTENSSITIKENIDPIIDALNIVSQLCGVTYDRKDGSAKKRAGFIAEQVDKVLPNVVQKDNDGNPSGIQYTNLIAYLVESIKELKTEINNLKKQNGTVS
jgi:hypothetical protein